MRSMRKDEDIDMIDLSTGDSGRRRRNVPEEDYLEDWDSRPVRRREPERRPQREGARRPADARTREGARRPADARMREGARRPADAGMREGARRPADQGIREGARRPADQRVRDTGRGSDNRRMREDGRNPSKRRRKKKHSGFKKFLIAILVLFLLIGAGLYWLVGHAYSKMKYEEIPSVASESMQEEGVINILLIGNDSRENGEDGRSDAMILLSISKKTKKIYMTSLLRDMYVDIPGHDGNRLNAAYSFGGPELLMQTIEQNLGIEVNRYVLVNFEASANLVDAVGGVDLELTNEEVVWVN